MTRLHKIYLDDQERLVVEFEPTNDQSIDFNTESFLSITKCKKEQNKYIYEENNPVKFNSIMEQIVDHFIDEFRAENVDLHRTIQNKLDIIKNNDDCFIQAKTMGEEIKNKADHTPNTSELFCRRLMDYQKESVEHMIKLGNAANFSVPGSGKTTITYAAISRWLEDGNVKKILIIGPTASFLPWEEEYKSCFRKTPRSCRVSGEVARELSNLGDVYDIFLIHFNSATNHKDELQKFMQKWDTVLIIDESHNIKSPKLRQWAEAAISIAPYAKRRIVLSGTPMPNDERDLWTQITFLWPANYPLDNQYVYNSYVQKNGIGKYKSILNSLFCRIKKDDLQLPKPKWTRYDVTLNDKQRCIYDIIAAKTLKEIDAELTIHQQAKLQKFRIARMVRLLQIASNPSLIHEKSSTFDVNSETFSEEFGLPSNTKEFSRQSSEIDDSIMDEIINYSKYEIPAKMIEATRLAKKLVDDGNKVIIWNSFIHNMDIFKNQLLNKYNPIVINGTVSRDLEKSGNRDDLINDFKNNERTKILIASPASLGESVSLHKNSDGNNICNHAIYLDRNFNGAQYMQSMDRIHRVGMDSSINVEYHVIIGKDTIDEVINRRLNEKWENMLDALNDKMLGSLDINPRPETINTAEFNKDYQDVVEHLRSHDSR